MCPYALNIRKGTIIQNADIGDLPGGVAVEINERQRLIAKHIINVVTFDSIKENPFVPKTRFNKPSNTLYKSKIDKLKKEVEKHD